MNIKVENNDLIVSGLADFNLIHIFECGQCFRWEKTYDGSYITVAFSKALKIKQISKDTVIFYQTTEEDFFNIWYNYFDMETNYTDIKKLFSEDDILRPAVEFGYGIRILNQDLWESVVSFIISASNNIPRIKKIISSLCSLYGEKIEYMGNVYYSFPTPEKILNAGISGLAAIKAGYRDKYIISAAQAFSEGMSLKHFENLDYQNSKKELMKIKGIGNKVADCILLFSLAKRNSFPVDVWIKRIVESAYFNGEEKSVNDICDFANERFDKFGGYAQQYLFYYARENKFGI